MVNKDGFGIKQFTKVDMPFNKKNLLNITITIFL